MLRKPYNPKAFLELRKNIRPGLVARTQIISFLEERAMNAKTITQKSKLSYAAVLYHLNLLETEGIIIRKGKKPFLWELTGAGQQRLRFPYMR